MVLLRKGFVGIDQVWGQLNEKAHDDEPSAIDCYLEDFAKGDGADAWEALCSTAGSFTGPSLLEEDMLEADTRPPRMLPQETDQNTMPSSHNMDLFSLLTQDEQNRLELFMLYCADHASKKHEIVRFRCIYQRKGLLRSEEFNLWPTAQTPKDMKREAYRLAEHVSEEYGISPRQSLRFLLTNHFPEKPSLRLISNHAEFSALRQKTRYIPNIVNLRLHISISAETVAKIWRQAQAKELRKQLHPIHGTWADLLRYVYEERLSRGIADDGTKQQRHEMWEEWNRRESDGKQRCFPSAKRFYEAWKRAEATLSREAQGPEA